MIDPSISITNNFPSIASTVRANPSAGFSIVSYTGTGSSGTLAHGLNAVPRFYITKTRNTAGDGCVYHADLTTYSDSYLRLNTNGVETNGSGAMFNSTAPTSSVFSVGTHNITNLLDNTYIAYCFAPVEGYSAMGSYTGNGSSADGPFVYTGMRPAFILIKNISAASNWIILDNARDPVNAALDRLSPNLSNAEDTTSTLDITSTGFKIRRNGTTENISGNTYIYAAFASHPFKTSRAR
jgi:hypothetical protein